MSCRIALLTFFFSYCEYASADCEDKGPQQCGLQDEVSLLQAFTGIKLQKKSAMLEAAKLGVADASSLAQTQVKVEEARTQTEWPADAAGQDESDEETCSLQGLTPGVCAMAALARAAPAPGDQSPDLDFYHPERLERALFSEIESALTGTHEGFTAEHVAEVEKELSNLFAALPKNKAGLLDHAAVRYAVHQRFVRRHGWYVRSLNPAGEAQRPPSPSEELRGRVPQHLQALVEKRSGGIGIGLRELTALVATLEHLIQGDMGERLKAAYAVHELPHNGTVSSAEVGEVLRTFMAHFLSLQHRSGYAISVEQARQERSEVEQDYDGWSIVDGFVAAVLRQLPAHLHFAEALSAAKTVMDRFESYSVEECRGIKQRLTGMPGGSTGRVGLVDFHKKDADGNLLFAESSHYLRTLGALDESEPGTPKVLVPNYVNSPSNCLGTTSFIDMCCPNECEEILDDLESALHSPDATPLELVDVIEKSRRWRLSGPLLAELERAAWGDSKGRLVIHGLAFARWLHAAFPRECPRPRAMDFKHHSSEADELPEAGTEFQAVADVPMAASEEELLGELSSNASNIPSAEMDIGSDRLKMAVVKAIAGSSAGRFGGVKVLADMDAVSLKQATTTVLASEDDSSTLEDSPTGSSLRKRGL